jgi:hypothetical protein
MKLCAGVVMVTLVALTGCASMGGRTLTKDASEDTCRQGKCTIDVAVIDPDGDCKVWLKPTTLNVESHVSGPDGVEIEWDLDTHQWLAGWSFADADGIIVRGDGQFKNKGRSMFKKKYTWTDTNATAGSYPYTVKLVKGDKQCSQDPSIVNRGS